MVMPSFSPAILVGFQPYRQSPTSPVTWATAGSTPMGLSASTLGSLPTIHSLNHSQDGLLKCKIFGHSSAEYHLVASGCSWNEMLSILRRPARCISTSNLQPHRLSPHLLPPPSSHTIPLCFWYQNICTRWFLFLELSFPRTAPDWLMLNL